MKQLTTFLVFCLLAVGVANASSVSLDVAPVDDSHHSMQHDCCDEKQKTNSDCTKHCFGIFASALPGIETELASLLLKTPVYFIHQTPPDNFQEQRYRPPITS